MFHDSRRERKLIGLSESHPSHTTWINLQRLHKLYNSVVPLRILILPLKLSKFSLDQTLMQMPDTALSPLPTLPSCGNAFAVYQVGNMIEHSRAQEDRLVSFVLLKLPERCHSKQRSVNSDTRWLRMQS